MGFSAWWSRLSALPVLHSSCSCLALFSYVFVCDRVSHVAVLVLNLQSYLRVAPHPSKPARPVSRLTLWFLETFDDSLHYLDQFPTPSMVPSSRWILSHSSHPTLVVGLS